MRALTIFIDEQWLAAVSEKNMSVPCSIIAEDLTEMLPVEVQYQGVTKTPLSMMKMNWMKRSWSTISAGFWKNVLR